MEAAGSIKSTEVTAAAEVSKHHGGDFPGVPEEEDGKNDQSLMPTLINDIYFGSFFIELWTTFKTILREYNKSTCIAAVSYIYPAS